MPSPVCRPVLSSLGQRKHRQRQAAQRHAIDQLIARHERGPGAEVDLAVQIRFLDVRREHDEVGSQVASLFTAAGDLRDDLFVARKTADRRLVIQKGQTKLLEIVRALRAARRFAGGLNRRKQQVPPECR